VPARAFSGRQGLRDREEPVSEDWLEQIAAALAFAFEQLLKNPVGFVS